MAAGYTVPIGKSGYLLTGEGLDKYDELIKQYIKNHGGGGSGEGHRYNSSLDSLAEGVDHDNRHDLPEANGARSHAEGFGSEANSRYSHAEGYKGRANGQASHAEGTRSKTGLANTANSDSSTEKSCEYTYNSVTYTIEFPGKDAHAEGHNTHAIGNASHAEGAHTYAIGMKSHAEGYETVAIGKHSHSEGRSTKAIGEQSHAEGYETSVKGKHSHVEGDSNHDDYYNSQASHLEGKDNSIEENSTRIQSVHIEGSSNNVRGDSVNIHIEGEGNYIQPTYSARIKSGHIEGEDNYLDNSLLNGDNSVETLRCHIEGKGNAVSGHDNHAEGANNKITGGKAVHIEGYDNEFWETENSTDGYGITCHIEGAHNILYSSNVGYTSSKYSHIEGLNNTANFGSRNVHIEGQGNTTDCQGAHVEGRHNTAHGKFSHAEGRGVVANGRYSHAEGRSTTADGFASHASGKYTRAEGCGSTATGIGTIAKLAGALSCGHYNVEEDALFIVGCGSNKDNRATAFKVYNSEHGGSATLTGHMHAGSFDETSDIRLKNVLGDISLEKAYDLVDKCQTILYTLKNDKTQSPRIGLIAQEVKEYFPEVVTVDEKGYYGIDYSNLTVVILKVLKDIIQRISKLENKETN